MGLLQDKIGLVTGSGQGIGRAIAQAFAREGAKVLVSDINSEAGEETVGLIRDAGGEAIFAEDDLIGVLVSGVFGHRVGKCLGFALLDIAAVNIGKPLSVEMLGERRGMATTNEPAFDSLNRRPRS